MTSKKENKKGTQPKFNKSMYSNILFLTEYYPTSKEFKEVFEENMFVKNNARAVIHVSHFLLNTLDPVGLKQRITVWPLLEKRDEGNFRIALLKYFNELNDVYKNFNFPVLVMSHLISPKRYQFGVFMFKLSQLCVFMYLKKNGDISTACFEVPNLKKNTIKKFIENTINITKEIEANHFEELVNFEELINEAQKEDNWISNEIKLNQEKILLKRKELNEIKSNKIEDVDFDEALILSGRDRIKKTKEICNKMVEHVTKLLSNDFIFEHKPGNVDSQENVKLHDLVRNINKLLENKSFEVHQLANQDWEHNITKIQAINAMQRNLISSLEKHHQNLTEMESVLQKMDKAQNNADC